MVPPPPLWTVQIGGWTRRVSDNIVTLPIVLAVTRAVEKTVCCEYFCCAPHHMNVRLYCYRPFTREAPLWAGGGIGNGTVDRLLPTGGLSS